jgi:hypothetical protein
MESSEKPRPCATGGEAEDEGARDLAALRRTAMGLAARLEQSAALAAAAPTEAAKLLGRNGVIECFAALARIVIRIVEVERHAPQAVPKTAAAPSATPKQSEQPFGQRIAAELDRVAARRRQAGICDPPDPEPPGRDRRAQVVG